MGAGQRLVEMVVRVDEPRQHDMARGVERRVDALRRLALPHTLGDPRPLDDEPALGAVGENRQRVLDPSPHGRPASSPSVPYWESPEGYVNRAAGAPRSHSSTSSTRFSNAPSPSFRSGPRGQRDIDDLIQFSRAGAAGRFDRHAAHDGDQVARQEPRGERCAADRLRAARAPAAPGSPRADGCGDRESPAAPNRRCRNRRARPEPLDTLAGSPGWRETPRRHARGRRRLRAPSGLEIEPDKK